MITPGISVWVVDDDESVRWVLEQALKQAHMIPRCFDSAAKFFAALDDARPDVLVTGRVAAGTRRGPREEGGD